MQNCTSSIFRHYTYYQHTSSLSSESCAHSQRDRNDCLSVVVALKQRSSFSCWVVSPQECVHTVIIDEFKSSYTTLTVEQHTAKDTFPPPAPSVSHFCPIITPCTTHLLPLHCLQPARADIRNFLWPLSCFSACGRLELSHNMSPEKKLYKCMIFTQWWKCLRHTFPVLLREQTIHVFFCAAGGLSPSPVTWINKAAHHWLVNSEERLL